MATEDEAEGVMVLHQRFTVPEAPAQALSNAQAFLEGLGHVSPRLGGTLERFGDRLVVHHGPVRTTVAARPGHEGTRVEVLRQGRAPWSGTRRWLVGVGLAAFLSAWALAVFQQRLESALTPLVAITLFLLGLAALAGILFLVDGFLERRGRDLLRSLEDAVRGDPMLVLRREVEADSRSTAGANALLFYFAALLAEAAVFVLLFSDGVRQGIDQALTLRFMRAGSLLPLVPAALFGLLWWVWARRTDARRLQEVLRSGAASDAQRPLVP